MLRWYALALAVMLALGLLLTVAGLARGAEWTVQPEPEPHTYAWHEWRKGASEVGPCSYHEATGEPIGTVERPLVGGGFRGTRLCVQGEGETTTQAR